MTWFCEEQGEGIEPNRGAFRCLWMMAHFAVTFLLLQMLVLCFLTGRLCRSSIPELELKKEEPKTPTTTKAKNATQDVELDKANVSDDDVGASKCSNTTTLDEQAEQEHYPLAHPHSQFVNPARRKLGLFRECSPCKCCTDYTRRFCYYTACCYRIDCFAAGLPFGHCSFTPVTCNCFRC